MRTRSILAGLLLPTAAILVAGAAEPAKLAAVKGRSLTGVKPAPSSEPAKPADKPADPSMKPADGMMKPADGTMMGGMAPAADAVSPEHKKFFEDKIQPILSEHCYKCHSLAENKTKGGLTMDTRDALRKGGDSGPTIKPGSPEASLMIKAISYSDPDMQMPPKSTGGKMSADKIALLTEWVKMGAPDPRATGAAKAIATKLSGLTDKARGHWSYLPLKKPAVPAVTEAERKFVGTPIDAFVVQKLKEKGLPAAPSMLDLQGNAMMHGKETLIRRAYMDMVGLPPSPLQIDAFQKDSSPQAFAKVVEELLASPHYGERWARFWLDSARYADTVGGNRNGNDKDDYRYAYAWTYRDWVIKSLNADMPYDKFILNQLAADQLPGNDRQNLAALGFITVGERFGNRNDDINDKIDVVTKGFLGLTVSCARCHDHMFDPIPTKDYYALHGIFSSIYEPDDLPMLNQPDPKLMKEFEAKIVEYEVGDKKTYFDVLEEEARLFREKARAYLTASRLNRNNEKDLIEERRMLAEYKLDEQILNYTRGRIGGDERFWGPMKAFREISDGDYDFLGPKIVDRIVNEGGKRYNKFVAEKFRGLKPKRSEDIFAVYQNLYEDSTLLAKAEQAMKDARTADKSKPVDRDLLDLAGGIFRVYPAYELDTERIRDAVESWPQRMRNRGRYNFAAINELKMTHDGSPAKAMIVADQRNPNNSRVFIRGQQTTQGDVVPRSFLEVLTPGGQRKAFTQGSGRLELAQSIASKETPLTARVIVNRVWMHHFGEGFVRTPDDLGTQSEKPSHPELIEYLAHWFINEGQWSLKNLHRFIMLSKVYQIGSDTHAKGENTDPDNRYLWRANVRRLDFEAVRDSLLAMSGKLDKTTLGQPVNLTDEPYSYRRTIYGYIDRGNLPELMAHFDFSDPHMPNSKRTTTIVPQQALFLMNSPFTVDVARAIVSRPEVANAATPIDRVTAIYKIVYQRVPKPQERETAFNFMKKEKDAGVQSEAEMADLTAKATAKVAERKKRMEGRGMNDQFRAIRNEGEYVERKPLDFWETYVHALLLSNEAAYVN